jgi:hypothetical protein
LRAIPGRTRPFIRSLEESVLDLPPGHEAPPAVVVVHDESVSAGDVDPLTRSIRAQISAAYSAGALPDTSRLEPGDGGGVIRPPGGGLQLSDGPVIRPPEEH